MNALLVKETFLAQIRLLIFNAKALVCEFYLPFCFPQRGECMKTAHECKALA